VCGAKAKLYRCCCYLQCGKKSTQAELGENSFVRAEATNTVYTYSYTAVDISTDKVLPTAAYAITV
jgi:hypothetical protein